MKFSKAFRLAFQAYRLPLLAGGFGFVCLLASVMDVLSGTPAGDSANAVLATSDSTPTPIVPSALDFSLISQWHVFGQAKATPGKLLEGEAVPETQLHLKLLGVLNVPEHPASTRAFIEAEDQTQKAYRRHDTLPGGAVLESIDSNKAVLMVDSRYESLTLKKLNSSPTDSSPTPP